MFLAEHCAVVPLRMPRSEARSAGRHHVQDIVCKLVSSRLFSDLRASRVSRSATACARFLETEPTPCRSRGVKLALNRPPSCARWLAGKSDWSRVDPSLRDSLLLPALLFLILSSFVSSTPRVLCLLPPTTSTSLHPDTSSVHTSLW